MSKAPREITKFRKERAPVVGEPVLVRMQPEMTKKLDDWRRNEADLPGRAEAIRRLVEIGLTHKPIPADGKPHKGAEKAKAMAKATLNDRMKHLPDEERLLRKKRLLKRPGG